MIKTARHSGGKKLKGPISLRQIYLMVGVIGTIILALILFGYYNGERLHDLNSPLLAACQEIRLEATAARHGIGDILSGIGKSPPTCLRKSNCPAPKSALND